MRAASCSLEQSLTTEAARVVKQAVNLATRRGHAQVTPLHVANTMLSSSTGVFRTACLQCNSHPLQCKALELCFNVALNRLPASTSNPMLSHLPHHPSISNALIAAFKRAQAQQRRGCIENQQQAVLDVKLEIEQLIISILDDPSVSRVMREAGFSSIQVKHNVEQAISLEVGSQSSPAGSLGLSVSPDRNYGEASGWSLSETGIDTQRADYSSMFETEPQNLLINSRDTATTSKLPSWLQQYKDENRRLTSRDLTQNQNSRPGIIEPKQPWSTSNEELNLRMYIPESRVSNPVLFSNLNSKSVPDSACSSEEMEMDYFKRFKELNTENFKSLCNELEQKVPWQNEIIPQIASTILQCRSGMIARKEKITHGEPKEETWFFFQGKDVEGKEKIARELACLVFGSEKCFHSIGLSSFSSPRSDLTEDSRNKRLRNESSCCYLDRLAEAIQCNPHRVFFVEDIEQVDYCSQLGFKRAIERGTIMKCNGNEVGLSDAIIILTCESFSTRSRPCSPSAKLKMDELTQEENGDVSDEEMNSSVALDLNLSAEEDSVNDESIDDIGLLEAVDKQIHFNLQDL